MQRPVRGKIMSISHSRNRHDMVTGVHENPHRRNRLHRATTMDNLITSDHEQPEDDDDEPNVTQLTNAIPNIPIMVQRNT